MRPSRGKGPRAVNELLAVRGVEIGFDGIRVLTGLDLTLQDGELRFLIGPNGAGKTTLLDVISGKVRPWRGSVRFAGRHDVLSSRPEQLARLGLARKFQTPSIFPSLTVWENVELAASMRTRLAGQVLPPSQTVRTRAREVLDMIGLEVRAQAAAEELAHGQQQWLEIGMLLAQEPRLMLLDEPVAGLTLAERDRTAALLRGIAGRCGMLIVEHDMAFVRRFDATVTVLHRGSVLTEGPMSAVQSDSRVIDVYLGKAPAREDVA